MPKTQSISEGKAIIKAYSGKISKKLPVFYNPVMKNNRDISVLVLNAVDNNKMNIGLPMEASGLRGIRFLKELSKGKVGELHMNDLSEKAVADMKQNLKLNTMSKGSKDKKDKISKADVKKVKIFQKDANIFLLESTGFDYIDIDPFGTPNPFLDSAVKRISREGILAVTATDTAPLCGTFEDACIRKYWARPLRNELMHEVGLRILIRKVQLIGAQYEKALTPIFSYSKEHYMRVFFRCEKSKAMADEIMMQHGYHIEAGPMWKGKIWDAKIAQKIASANSDKDLNNFLATIAEESLIDVFGFYDLTEECKRNKIYPIPRLDELISLIRKKGFAASRTHFRDNSIRTTMDEDEFLRAVKEALGKKR